MAKDDHGNIVITLPQNNCQEQQHTMPRIGNHAPEFTTIQRRGRFIPLPPIVANGRFSSVIPPTSHLSALPNSSPSQT